jgi:hypothetical protein
MSLNPTIYKTFTNSLDQLILLVEHPLRGDESPIIVVCKELALADYSDFYELGEIDEVGGDYEIGFIANELFHGLN